jgi:hypothetical protein
MASEFVGVSTQGMDKRLGMGRDIILSLAGPRGGTVTTQSLSIEQAMNLMGQLSAAIANLEGKSNRVAELEKALEECLDYLGTLGVGLNHYEQLLATKES